MILNIEESKVRQNVINDNCLEKLQILSSTPGDKTLMSIFKISKTNLNSVEGGLMEEGLKQMWPSSVTFWDAGSNRWKCRSNVIKVIFIPIYCWWSFA